MKRNSEISLIKYKVWCEEQKPNIKNYIDLDYDLLKQADDWKDKEDRVNFKNKQTE